MTEITVKKHQTEITDLNCLEILPLLCGHFADSMDPKISPRHVSTPKALSKHAKASIETIGKGIPRMVGGNLGTTFSGALVLNKKPSVKLNLRYLNFDVGCNKSKNVQPFPLCLRYTGYFNSTLSVVISASFLD